MVEVLSGEHHIPWGLRIDVVALAHTSIDWKNKLQIELVQK